jgi:hypothetical protein
MSKDVKSNISGTIALVMLIIQHYFNWDIPQWVIDYIILPVALGAAGHVAWLVGKPETKTETKIVVVEPSKVVTP